MKNETQSTAPNTQAMDGSMRPFMFENLPIRGRLLRMPNITDQVGSLKSGENTVAQLLAEMLAASVVLAFDMKDKANITLQITSKGKLPVLLAKCNYKGELRAYAKKTAPLTEEEQALEDNGNSVFTVTVDYGRDRESYQSIVPIETSSITSTVETYFQQSAQLPTYFKVFSHADEQGRTSCGAFFLQALPHNEPVSDDDWRRMGILLSTLHADEVLPGKVQDIDLLSRLFAEDDVRVFHKQALSFASHSNRDRMLEALKNIGAEECRILLEQEGGTLEMTDEFTGVSETFTEADIAPLFGDDWTPARKN